MIECLGIGHLFELSRTEAIGVFHPARDLRRVLPGAAHTAWKVGPRLIHQSGDRRAPQLSAERYSGIYNRADRVGVRAHRAAVRSHTDASRAWTDGESSAVL